MIFFGVRNPAVVCFLVSNFELKMVLVSKKWQCLFCQGEITLFAFLLCGVHLCGPYFPRSMKENSVPLIKACCVRSDKGKDRSPSIHSQQQILTNKKYKHEMFTRCGIWGICVFKRKCKYWTQVSNCPETIERASNKIGDFFNQNLRILSSFQIVLLKTLIHPFHIVHWSRTKHKWNREKFHLTSKENVNIEPNCQIVLYHWESKIQITKLGTFAIKICAAWIKERNFSADINSRYRLHPLLDSLQCYVALVRCLLRNSHH